MTESAVRPVAVVTGASSGIGAATTRRLAIEGYHVVATARRTDRLTELARELTANGAQITPVTCDVTSDAEVEALATAVRGIGAPVAVLVNNAGGAHGLDPVETASVEDWQWMYDVNVLGTLRVTKALLPDLDPAAGHDRDHELYRGADRVRGRRRLRRGQAAQTALAETLRLELCGRPIRVVEIDPGMVRTDEFGLVRFGGDAERAAAAYAGVAEPLVAEDIADCVAWTVTRPHHVNIDRLVVRPLAQAAQHKVHRVS